MLRHSVAEQNRSRIGTTGMPIDTRNFAPGMYTVVVRTNDRTLTARLMKADER